MIFLSKILTGSISLVLSKNIYVQSCPLPLHSERYPHFKTMNNFKLRMRELCFFIVACEIANKLSELRLDLRERS